MKVRISKYIVLYISVILIYLIFIMVTYNKLNINGVNILIFINSLMLVTIGLRDFLNKGINTRNVFLIVFFGCLLLNCIPISRYQESKTFTDMYFFFFGPLIFSLFLFFGENVKKKKIGPIFKITIEKQNNINDSMCMVLLIIYCFLKIIIFRRTGIRFFSDQWSSQSNENYVIPGISGISEMLMWSLVMYIPHVNNKLKFGVLVSVILCSSVFVAARGDMFRIFLFLLFFYLIRSKTIIKDKRKMKQLIKRTIVLVLVILILFSIVGEYRQYVRSGFNKGAFSITEDLNSKIDNFVINWIYSYTAINFDVLKQVFIEKFSSNPLGKCYELQLPCIRLLKGNSELALIMKNYPTHGIDGINASTFLSRYIADLGYFYWIEIIGLGFIVSFFISLSKRYNFLGLYCYLLLMISLSVFGDYIMNPNYFFAMIFTTLLWIFTNNNYISNKVIAD